MGVQQSYTGQMDITSVVRGVEQHLSLAVKRLFCLFLSLGMATDAAITGVLLPLRAFPRCITCIVLIESLSLFNCPDNLV